MYVYTVAGRPDSIKTAKRSVSDLAASMSRPITAVLLALAIAGCAAPPQLRPLAQPGEVMPAPKGALNPDVTQETIGITICVSGWAATVRPSSTYTNGVKAKLLREHGLQPSDASRFELDHLVPLTLGGHPRRIENLWLQRWDGEWSARRKDQLEVKLKNLVCAGQVTLAEARRAIAADWRAAWRQFVGSGSRDAVIEPVE